MPNFQNGKIYSIRSHQTDKIYIGSTTQSLAVRFGGHKRQACSSREILLFDDAYIELIENYPCADKNELHRREGEIIRTTECVNKQIAGRTQAEYREDNKESRNQYNKQYLKQYRQEHAEKTKHYNKRYRVAHKKMRICSCGVEYNSGKRNRHYGSKHHIEFVNGFYERLHQLLECS